MRRADPTPPASLALQCLTMQRVVILGTAGSGKSWLAGRLAARLDLRIVELDALFWGPDWQPAPFELFRYRIECETRDGDWIVVGNYGQVRDLVWREADTLVWIDLPLRVVMVQLLGRTVWRIATAEDLWGTGNRESVRKAFFSRDSILLWALKTHQRNRVRFEAEFARLPETKRVVRLQSRRAVERFAEAT
jgi:adenylate kinase family enzyme